MSKRTVTVSLKTAILFVALCGVCMCAFGFSASVSHMTGGEKSAVYWAHMALCWAASVPCFVLLAIGWAVASRVLGDRLFTSRTADLLDRIVVGQADKADGEDNMRDKKKDQRGSQIPGEQTFHFALSAAAPCGVLSLNL